MRKSTRALVSLTLLAGLAHLPLAAQQPPAAAATDEKALSEIATALTRIASVLEKQLVGGRLDLLMKRVESGQRRLDQVDNRLRSAQHEYQAQLQSRSRMEMELANFSNETDMEALGYDAASITMQVNHLEFELEQARGRLEDLEVRISGLENEKVQRLREVEDWQDFIDRELSGLQ